MSRLSSIPILLFVFFATGTALAAPYPSSDTAGSEETRFKEERKRLAEAKAKAAATAPKPIAPLTPAAQKVDSLPGAKPPVPTAAKS